MSAQFPTLAEVVADHFRCDEWGGPSWDCGADPHCDGGGTSYVDYAEHVQDVWRDACTITTVEQLDALPIGSVVRSLGGTDIGDIYVNWADHHLASLYGPWYRSGYEVPCPSDEVDLPAVVLYIPEVTA